MQRWDFEDVKISFQLKGIEELKASSVSEEPIYFDTLYVDKIVTIFLIFIHVLNIIFLIHISWLRLVNTNNLTIERSVNLYYLLLLHLFRLKRQLFNIWFKITKFNQFMQDIFEIERAILVNLGHISQYQVNTSLISFVKCFMQCTIILAVLAFDFDLLHIMQQVKRSWI